MATRREFLGSEALTAAPEAWPIPQEVAGRPANGAAAHGQGDRMKDFLKDISQEALPVRERYPSAPCHSANRSNRAVIT